MENSYGIGVRNRYELFYNEDIDPMDLLKQTEKIKDKASEKENKGKTAKAKSPVVKKGVKTETAPKISDKTSLPVKDLVDVRLESCSIFDGGHCRANSDVIRKGSHGAVEQDGSEYCALWNRAFHCGCFRLCLLILFVFYLCYIRF
nr:uncharacterized protein LOC128698736 isoform X1 [Cherax quadricarinatus]